MASILISPGKYVQGSNELKNLNVYTEALGTKALVLITSGGYKRIGKLIDVYKRQRLYRGIIRMACWQADNL